MAAHNEEKLIANALNRLVEVHNDYNNMEVIIGMDGCTDRTPDIVAGFVKRHKFFRAFKLNERKGKQAVLEKLEPHITGNIVVIHDADWTFVYRSKQDLLDYMKMFDDEKIGGVSESVDSEMSRSDFLNIKSMGFLASAWGNHLILLYLKKNFTQKKKGFQNVYVYAPRKIRFYPLLDVYKKKVMDLTEHKHGLKAGDHVERSLRIINAGYEIAGFNNDNWPHFLDNYNAQSIKDLINQKVRGIIAKSKLQASYNFNIPFFGFYMPFLLFVIKNSFRIKRRIDFFAIYTFIFVMFYSHVLAKIKQKLSQKDIWALRIKR